MTNWTPIEVIATYYEPYPILPGVFFILQETGDKILQETGDKIFIENLADTATNWTKQ